MSDSFVLNDKRAVVFGGGGSIGSAVARAFGAEGAEVFVAGRSKSKVDAVARQINEGGGRARPAVVDALDDTAVGKYLDLVVEQAGRIDVEFNAVLGSLADSAMLKESPHTEDTANAAVLLASDRARMMTGTVHNATAGACPD